MLSPHATQDHTFQAPPVLNALKALLAATAPHALPVLQASAVMPAPVHATPRTILMHWEWMDQLDYTNWIWKIQTNQLLTAI